MKLNLERWGETILGAIVVVVAVGFFAFAAAQGSQKGPSGRSYDLIARFDNASSISVGSDVRMAGVKVGVVRAMALDNDTYRARLTFAMNEGVRVLDQSTARVTSDGLLGGGYIAIETAGMDVLPPGREIPNTQSYTDIITVLSSAASGMSQSGQGNTQDSHP